MRQDKHSTCPIPAALLWLSLHRPNQPPVGSSPVYFAFFTSEVNDKKLLKTEKNFLFFSKTMPPFNKLYNWKTFLLYFINKENLNLQ